MFKNSSDMFKKTNLFKINKFNFFKRGFAIHKVGDFKDLEFIEKRTLLLKNLSKESKLIKSHNRYIDFVVKNKNLKIDDNNGKYIDEDSSIEISFLLFIPTLGLSMFLHPIFYLINKIRGYKYIDSDEVDYLNYKLLSDESFMKHIDKQNEIENIEKFKI